MAEPVLYECRIEGSVIGAMTAAGLRALVAEGKLGPNDHIRKLGTNDWVLARSIRNLFPTKSSPSEANSNSAESPGNSRGALVPIPPIQSQPRESDRCEALPDTNNPRRSPGTNHWLFWISFILIMSAYWCIQQDITWMARYWCVTGGLAAFGIALLVRVASGMGRLGELSLAGVMFAICLILCGYAYFAKHRGGVPLNQLDRASITLIGTWIESGGFFLRPNADWHGSGFVYERDGDVLRVLTNSHCIGLADIAQVGKNQFDQRADITKYELTVHFPSGKRGKVTRIAETTTQGLDIAKLEVSADGLVEGTDYVLVPLVPKTLLRHGLQPGDEVIAAGSPISPLLRNSQTFGRISALRWWKGEPVLWLQHDAQIAPGSSGGPLFLRDGKNAYLIGVNTRVVPGYAFSYAISTDFFINSDFTWDDATPAGAARLVDRIYRMAAKDSSPKPPAAATVSTPFHMDVPISLRPTTLREWLTIVAAVILLLARAILSTDRK